MNPELRTMNTEPKTLGLLDAGGPALRRRRKLQRALRWLGGPFRRRRSLTEQARHEAICNVLTGRKF